MADDNVTHLKTHGQNPNVLNMSQLQANLGIPDADLLARQRFFRQFNIAGFKDNRDFFKTFGYPDVVSFEACLSTYNRGGIAKRIVNMPAEGVWRKPPKIAVYDENDKALLDNDFKEPWDMLLNELHMAKAFETADKLAGMGAYAVIHVGFDDVRDISQLARQVKKGAKPVYFRAYHCLNAVIDEYETDPQNPAYGKPKYYKLNPSSNVSANNNGKSVFTQDSDRKAQNDIKVHASRIIHITDDALETELYGHPRLVNVYNYVLDLIKIVGGSAETYWLTGNRGLHVNVDKDMKLKPEDAAALADEVQDYQDNMTRVLRTRGVDVANLGSDVADPTGPFRAIVAMISASTGIPQRSLIGAEAGQLASSQDQINWANYIIDRRSGVAVPIYLAPTIKLLQEVEFLPKEPYKLVWPKAYMMSPLEEAQTAAQKARVLANIMKALGEGTEVVTVEEVREIFGFDEARIGD